ncbi:2699_t:CDS:2, partial [Racocetra persica]
IKFWLKIGYEVMNLRASQQQIEQLYEAQRQNSIKQKCQDTYNGNWIQSWSDISNVAAEFSHAIQTLYDCARKGKFPVNTEIMIRIIKSTESLLSNTFDRDQNL